MERAFHDWLNQRTHESNEVALGIGDDAAVMLPSPAAQVVTTDTIAEGTHFQTRKDPLKLIGRKSLAVSLSDIAAMGATPVATTLHWQLPKRFELPDAQELFLGIEELAGEHGVAIVGGDTNRWDGELVIGTTVIGRLDAKLAPWRLNAAAPGDAIVVSGAFGGSINGHHLSFQPAVKLAQQLRPLKIVRAATDATDSLGRDLGLMAAASQCGAVIEPDAIPLSDAVRQHSSSEKEAIAAALSDGEDFGLILAIRESDLDRLSELHNDESARLTRIGTFCQQQGLWSRGTDGTLEKLDVSGYDH